MSGGNRKRNKLRVYLMILAVVIITMLFFILISVLDLPFRWAFDLLAVILATAFIYYILRTFYYACYYELIGGNLAVKQKIGSGERYVLAVDRESIVEIVDGDRIKEKIDENKIKKIDRLYDESQKGEKGLIYRDSAGKRLCMLVFTPDEELLNRLLHDGE